MDNKLIKLIVGSLSLIIISGISAYRITNSGYKKTHGEDMGIKLFLNNGIKEVTTKQIMVGMAYGIIFGFIDNAGLWFGMDAPDPYLPGGNLTKAGLGNTFSDLIGSLLGTFGSVIITKYSNVDEKPIWAESIGIVIGCLLGIYIPKTITGLQYFNMDILQKYFYHQNAILIVFLFILITFSKSYFFIFELRKIYFIYFIVYIFIDIYWYIIY